MIKMYVTAVKFARLSTISSVFSIEITDLERFVFSSAHKVKDECRQNVETQTVADFLVPPGVGEQHPREHDSLLVVVLAAEVATTSPVQVLLQPNRNHLGCILND